jgi:hypothetical protein
VRVWTAAVVSLVVHAGFAWIAMREAAVDRVAAPAVPLAPSVALHDPPATPDDSHDDPLDIVLIDDAALDASPAAAAASPSAVAPSAAPSSRTSSHAAAPATAGSLSTTAGAAAEIGRGSDAPGEPAADPTGAASGPAHLPRTRSLAMRGPDLRLPEPFLDRIAHSGRAPEPIARSGRVAPAGGGTAVIEDRVTTVHVARDGTVRFEDKPDFEIHFTLPSPARLKQFAEAAGRQLTTWYADPYAKSRVGTMHDVPAHLSFLPGACDHWDDPCSRAMRARNRGAGEQPDDEPLPPLLWGKFEYSDALIRAFSGDPYASRKLKLLDATRAERAAMAEDHRADDLARSAELTLRNLEALWRTIDAPEARRDALFAMWDECAEGDDADGIAGQRARLMIIGWIRSRLPSGSPDAFDPDEIAARSAQRRSRQPFAPYE